MTDFAIRLDDLDLTLAEFDESEHPRGEDGKFADAGGGSSHLNAVKNVSDLRKVNGIGSVYDDEKEKFYNKVLVKLHNKNTYAPLDRWADRRPKEFAKLRTAMLLSAWQDSGSDKPLGDFIDRGEVTAYRGVPEGGQDEGRSWSLYRHMAEGFAKHGSAIGLRREGGLGSLGRVIERKIPAKDIMAYSDAQGERELVLWPEKRDVSLAHVADIDKRTRLGTAAWWANHDAGTLWLDAWRSAHEVGTHEELHDYAEDYLGLDTSGDMETEDLLTYIAWQENGGEDGEEPEEEQDDEDVDASFSEATIELDGALVTLPVLDLDFDPDQPRADDGKWSSTGGAAVKSLEKKVERLDAEHKAKRAELQETRETLGAKRAEALKDSKLAKSPLQPHEQRLATRMATHPQFRKYVSETGDPNFRKFLASQPATNRAALDLVGVDRSMTTYSDDPGEGRVDVTATYEPKHDRTFVEVVVSDGDGDTEYSMGREVYDDHIKNVSFEVTDRGKGKGTEIFDREVQEASDLGFDRIETHAVRSGFCNGYYTWARLGYDAEIPNEKTYPEFQANPSSSSGPPTLRKYAMEKFSAEKISDLMRTPEGRAWWKENGVSFHGTFDLKEGSLSRRVLDGYNDARRARAKEARGGGTVTASAARGDASGPGRGRRGRPGRPLGQLGRLGGWLRGLLRPGTALGLAQRSYGSTQFNLPDSVSSVILGLSGAIPDDLLADPDDGKGREDEPHVTVLYGLTSDSFDEIRPLLPPSGVRVMFGEMSLFETDDADVLKVDVESRELRALHERLYHAVPNEQTHPTYEPHATVAYLKKGEGKKYVGPLPGVTGRTVALTEFKYSDKDEEARHVSLSAARTIELEGRSITLAEFDEDAHPRDERGRFAEGDISEDAHPAVRSLLRFGTLKPGSVVDAEQLRDKLKYDAPGMKHAELVGLINAQLRRKGLELVKAEGSAIVHSPRGGGKTGKATGYRVKALREG